MPCSDVRDPDPGAGLEGLELLPMSADDLDQVLVIEESSFMSPWRREHFLYEMEQNRCALNWVAKLGAEVVGYACIWHLDRELKINNLAVLEGRRGQGIGRYLLRRVLADATRCGCRVAHLEVRPSNRAARHLYEEEGFFETGRRRNYYEQEGEDAILMERVLG
jgi:[ribosomal protein S18]-alanine N-acetyltransferase